jgi:hypothetical protein
MSLLYSDSHIPAPPREFFFFFFAVLGFELRAYTLSYSTSPIFVMAFFEIGSPELFAWAGFEPQSF